MQAEIQIKPGDRFIRLPEVRALTGRSKSQIYADPTFPRPIKLSLRESAWLYSSVVNWMQAKVEAARGKSA
jgi:prophage regulatory protein